MDIKLLLLRDFTRINSRNLVSFKRAWAKELGGTPKNSHILNGYRFLVKQNKLKKSDQFEQLFKIKKVRSLSGVTPMAVMTKPFYCPGQCTFCPIDLNLPKSYLRDEPAAQRALQVNFDPYLQITSRLKQFKEIGHQTDKVELI